jgi:hypothetical protein
MRRTRGHARFLVGVTVALSKKNIFAYASELQREGAIGVRYVDRSQVLNLRKAAQIVEGTTRRPKGAGLDFIPAILEFLEKVRREIHVTLRLERYGLLGSREGRPMRRSASGGLPLPLRFSGDRSLHGGARRGIAGRRRNDFGDGGLGFREKGGGRVEQGADHFSGGHGRRLQGLMVVEHPSGEHGLRRLLNPLIDQGGNFLSQIRGVIEPCQLKTLQRGARCRLQIVERRSESRNCHGQSSNLWAGPKGPASECIRAQY